MSLADIRSEQEDFESAIAEYEACVTILYRMQPEPKRRIADAHFRLSLTLEVRCS